MATFLCSLHEKTQKATRTNVRDWFWRNFEVGRHSHDHHFLQPVVPRCALCNFGCPALEKVEIGEHKYDRVVLVKLRADRFLVHALFVVVVVHPARSRPIPRSQVAAQQDRYMPEKKPVRDGLGQITPTKV